MQVNIIPLDDWNGVFTMYFSGCPIGFAVGSDLNFLASTFPDLVESIERSAKKIVDVQKLVIKVSSNKGYSKSLKRGILGRCNSCSFEENLEKNEQTSNWCTRPLSQFQIEYAAQDAHYHLECYQKLKHRFVCEYR